MEGGNRRRSFVSALEGKRYEGELNWFVEFALDVYDTF